MKQYWVYFRRPSGNWCVWMHLLECHIEILKKAGWVVLRQEESVP